MWTQPLQQGGVVGGNEYTTTQGVGYFEGSAYQSRFANPIIIDGYLYYKEPVAFTGPSAGPLVCVNLQTGQQVWSSAAIPPLSFGYIYNTWQGEQHGVFPPILVAAIGGGITGLPSMWECFDAFTGEVMFNITGVPGFAPQTGQLIAGQPAVALTTAAVAGPSSEQIRYVFMNDGTAANPNWYLAQWNSSDLWQYDVNPYTFGGSLSPSVINATNGVLVSTIPIPILGETGTAPNGASVFVPYGSSLTVNANIPLNSTTVYPLNTGARTTYDWNVSVPWLNTMPLQPTLNTATGLTTTPTKQGTATDFLAAGGTNPVTVVGADYGDVMLCRNGSFPNGFSTQQSGYPQLPYTLFAVNLNASMGAIGSILWMQNYNPPAGNITICAPYDVALGVDFQTRVFVFDYKETMQWVGYSLTTGALLWGPTAPMNAMEYYGLGTGGNVNGIAYGNIYTDGMGGVCYCYNDLTGALLWTYGNGGAGNSTYSLSSPYGEYPTAGSVIGDGVVYLATTEHTATDPIYKGALYRAINATTGQEIWTLSGYGSSIPVIADGFETWVNGYDMQIYTVGRGPSATTVTAPDVAAPLGTPVVIKGTVMDTSAGTQQTTVKADFPNGVPVASDASMSAWMSYVYQQQAFPTNFTGVQVTINVIDSNGNYRTIGTETTTSAGTYSLTWTPDIPGNYTVIASFAGTNGYWGSSSQNAFTVMQAPAATATPTPAPASVVNTYFVPAVIAIIVVIIIGFALLAILSLRKRP
jgi:hypothetical protein